MIRTAVFDLDGTLADTAPDLVGAANDLLAGEGIAPMPVAAAERTAGFGGKALIRKGFELAGRNVAEETVDALYHPFLERYRVRIAEETRLYPGALEALDRLSEAGWVLGICTNKPEALALDLLEKLGVLHRFAGLIGADTLPVRKPHPKALFETIERCSGAPERTVFIGDTETDLKTARNAEVPCILTSFGYSQHPVHTLKPDRVVAGFEDIPEAVTALMAARDPA